MPRVLLTGASGLLGRRVHKKLMEAGHDVVGVSRMREAAGASVKVDLRDAANLKAILGKFDVVVHLAALLPSPTRSPAPADWFQHNTASTLALLEFCVERGARHFVLGSSWSVYGDPTANGMVSESLVPDPADLYSISKYSAELLCAPFKLVHGLRCCMLRFGYIVGPGMRADTVVRQFLDRATDGAAMRVTNGGVDVTDLVAVADAADAVVRAVSSGAGPINVGSGAPSTILQLARECAMVGGKAANIEVQPADRRARTMWLGVDRAASELGWRPNVSLRSALSEVLQAS